MRDVFHDATYFLCAKHLKDNFINYMRNKCGIQQASRTCLVGKLFGEGNGLLYANDFVTYKQQADAFAAECKMVSPQLEQHFTRHVEPAVRAYVLEPSQRHGWLQRRWTNNACESVNHMLKLSIDWRPRRLPELVECLHKVADTQISDMRRALYVHGNYTVTDTYQRFVIAHYAWQ